MIATMDLLKSIRSSFSQDYAEARGKFLLSCAGKGLPVRSYKNPHSGPKGEALFTDTAWFGPTDAGRLLVTISATHGVEGFCGSGAQVDWLESAEPALLPKGVAALFIHAINPYGFAWLRRVTEEGVDLNRNFVDFAQPLPENPGYDELADALVPREIGGPAFEEAERKLQSWLATHGERAFQDAYSGGQYKHPGGLFYGGAAPTWARRTLEAIIGEYQVTSRELVAVVDYHTGLGPFGYGEPICGHPPGSPGHARALAWYGDSVTVPALGTSSSVPKAGLADLAWIRALGDKATYIALEFGTYDLEQGRRALQEDHWLHNYGAVDWNAAETRRIKAQIRRQFFPDTSSWKELVLFRSRQVLRQALVGLAARLD